MTGALLIDVLRRRRRLLLIGWLAATVIPALYLAMFPSIESLLAGFSDLPEAMSAVIGDVDIATPGGYFASEVLAITGPLLISSIAISLGTGLVAAENDRTLTAVLFSPAGRSRLVTTHLTTVLLGVIVGCVLILVASASISRIVGIDLAMDSVINGLVPLAGLGLFAGNLAFAASAASGSAGAGTVVAWGGLLAALLANSAGQLVTGVGWLADASPWGWYGGGQSMTTGIEPTGLTLLIAGAAAFALIGHLAFSRRDLRL